MVIVTDSVLAGAKPCVCCGKAAKTRHRQPLCSECAAPGEVRTYCAKCGSRGGYPVEDFIRVMSSHYPGIDFAPGMVVRLPACAACNQDGRPAVDGGEVRFHGICFD